MRKTESITNIMSESVISVEEGQALSVVRKLMTDHAIHHVPVVNASILVGIISFTDMMKLDLVCNGATEHTINAILDQQFSIKDVMTTDVTSINKKDSIRSAAKFLSEGNFHSLPVVDAHNLLLGIVTSTDLIRYLNSQY
jgi:CBS domain-containing protein